MKNLMALFFMMVVALLFSDTVRAQDMGTAFSFQGKLSDGGAPAQGKYDMQFYLYDTLAGGSPIGGPINYDDLNIEAGMFTVMLDFGDIFTGPARWLQIGVRPWNTAGDYTTLLPRNKITPSPYALYALNSGAGGGGVGGEGTTNCIARFTDTTTIGDSSIFEAGGNVGIGTATPLSKLSLGTTWNPRMLALWDGVDDFYGFGTDIARMTFYTMNTEKMTLNSLGWLGIGTPYPAGYLDITGTNDAMVLARINQTGNKQYAGWRLDRDGMEKWFVGMNNADDNLTFRRNAASNDMAIKSANGYVGIGTINPQQLLHVYGTVNPRMLVESPSNATPELNLKRGTEAWGLFMGSEADLHFFHNGTKATLSNSGNFGIGTSSPATKLEVRGNIRVSNAAGSPVVELGEGLDYAEGFDISGDQPITPGDVCVIDPDNPGRLKISSEPYDRKVAGIIAGANGLGSGVRLGTGDYDHDVALAGRVYCNVDATYGEISPGDLLTTSPTAGYAMVVKDHDQSQGAIIGKAMENLAQGKKGQILVLVTLQ